MHIANTIKRYCKFFIFYGLSSECSHAKSKQELSCKLLVEKIEAAYMTHLPIGPAEKEGLLAFWLYPLPGHGPDERTIEGQFNGILQKG